MGREFASDSPTIFSQDARLVCACGHEYSRDEHARCPACGSEATVDVVAEPSADEDLTVSCDFVFVSKSGSVAGMVYAPPGKTSNEGHRAHLAEVMHVKEKDAEIRATRIADPDAVSDRESFLTFAAQLASDRAKRPAKWKNATIEAYLDAAVTWARQSKQPAGLAPQATWKDFARFLLAGKGPQ